MTLRAEAKLLAELEEGTDAIGRRLGNLIGGLSRSSFETLETRQPPTAGERQAIVNELLTLQLLHTELRAQLWTYAEGMRRKAATP